MGLKGFAEGGVASIVAGCSTHPLDLIKVRMQLQGESSLPKFNPNPQFSSQLRPALAFHGNPSMTVNAGLNVDPFPQPRVPVRAGPISVGVRIFQTEGVSALFSGVSATMLRQAMYSRVITSNGENLYTESHTYVAWGMDTR